MSRSWLRALGLTAGVGGIYWLLAWLGYLFIIRPAGIALWPAGGFLLGALLLLDRRDWPAALAGGFLGNLGADLPHGLALDFALAAGLANVLESAVAATLLRLALGRRVGVGTLREVGWIIIGGAVLSNAVTAFGGAFVLSHWSLQRFRDGWLFWWIGDGMGMLIVTPVMLAVAALIREKERLPRKRVAEAVAVLAAVALVALLVLRRDPHSPRPLGGYPYLAFPPLLWAAVRFGPWGAALSTLILGAVSIWNAAHPVGSVPATGRSPIGEALEIYSFLGLAAVSSLVPASFVNQQRRAQRELAESEGRFRQMAESIQEAFFVVDAASRLPLYVSPTWAQIWGRPLQEGFDPNLWLEAIHPDDRPAVAEAQRRVIAGEADLSTFRVIRPDGSVRWVRGRTFPVRDGNGTVYRLVGVAEDFTELRQTELQLVQAQKMESVGRLAGGVAHDFNNLLTVILAEVDLLLDRAGTDAATHAALRQVRGAAERATVLTGQLLAFSRRQVVEPVVFDLNALVRDTTALLRRLIGEDIELVLRLGPEPLLVRADRGQIEQVVTNLAVNARDAMPEGGTLTLESRPVALASGCPGVELGPGSYVVLAVSDSGVGMTDAVKARIFEPFFTTKVGGRGTGLGLSTSYGIAQQAGGQLTVSTEPGAGSTFRLYLPRVDQAEAVPAPSLAPAPKGSETILLVEDEAAVRRVAIRMLQGHGYRVLEAENAETAKALLASHPGPVHLLFTDVVLPGQGGRELADEVRALHPDVKVLFTSGHTDDAILRGRLADHDAELLQKPYTRDSLTRKVREVLG